MIKRYKRFLADIRLPDNEEITIHCANTGAMTGCATTGDTIWYSTSNNTKRKYPHSWELTQTNQGDTICVNTARRSTAVAIETGIIRELAGYEQLKQKLDTAMKIVELIFYSSSEHPLLYRSKKRDIT